MEKITKRLLWAVLALCVCSCSDGQESIPIHKLGARLAAYDEAGTERTGFEANANIRFMLRISNNSANEIDVGSPFDYCHLYQDEEFLLVYKLIREDNGNEKWIPYGKPYRPPVYCESINLPIIVPPSGEANVAGGTWKDVPENPPFTAGEYYTAFSLNLELGGTSRKYDLKLEFEVY